MTDETLAPEVAPDVETHEAVAPAPAPVPEAPDAPSSPSVVSEAPAAAPIVPPVGAAALVPDEPVADPVVEPEPVAETERAKVMGVLHHIATDIENFGAMLESHAHAAMKAGETDVHSALSRIATLFGEFRNGLMSAGKTMPPTLEAEAAGLVAKAKA